MFVYHNILSILSQSNQLSLHTAYMRGSRNFCQGGGGPGQSDKKSSDVFFFLVLSLFDRSQMVNFKVIYHFSRFQRGSNIFQGGGSNCLFSIETHITCDFPGGVWTPSPLPPPPPPRIRNWPISGKVRLLVQSEPVHTPWEYRATSTSQ